MTEPSEKKEQESLIEMADVAADGPKLEWSTHPMRRRPLVTALLTLFIFVCGMGVYITMDYSVIFAVFALVVLFMSLAKFYLPTRYIMNGHGLIVRTTTQKIEKPWSMYRSFYPDKSGVLLSPFADPTRLENFRGLYILFDNNRDEVVAFLKERISSKPATKESDK